MLNVRNLMVFYENALAINDLSLEVREKEIVGVIGSNSAGKSTLLNTIGGLTLDLKIKERRKGGERITVMGQIDYLGENITEMLAVHRVKRGIVLCRERHPIFPESDVMENLRIAAYLQTKAHFRKIAAYAFELFPQLRDKRKKRSGFLSGGEQQMLAIGMALVAGPKLLLLDEPLLGLSPAMQTRLVGAIKDIRERLGITIVISEQFARPVLPMIDRGYIIENGMLVLAGTGRELMENPEVKSAYFGV
jgi:branched-chain amino acid transport system ATP-binding protein